MSNSNFRGINSYRFVTFSDILDPIANASQIQSTNIDPSLSPTDGQTLTWDNATSQWRATTTSVPSTDASSLRGTNIDPSLTPTDGQTLTWNNAGSQWEATAPSADATALRGTNIDPSLTPTDGQILTWNNAGSQWEATAPSADATALRGTNIDPSLTPTDGQILTWNNAGSQWEATTPSTNSYNITSINSGDSPYTVLSTDYLIIVDTSGGVITINLPEISSQKRQLIITDGTGDVSSNNITIQTGGSDTILGASNLLINSDYTSVNLISDANNRWFVV